MMVSLLTYILPTVNGASHSPVSFLGSQKGFVFKITRINMKKIIESEISRTHYHEDNVGFHLNVRF